MSRPHQGVTFPIKSAPIRPRGSSGAGCGEFYSSQSAPFVDTMCGVGLMTQYHLWNVTLNKSETFWVCICIKMYCSVNVLEGLESAEQVLEFDFGKSVWSLCPRRQHVDVHADRVQTQDLMLNTWKRVGLLVLVQWWIWTPVHGLLADSVPTSIFKCSICTVAPLCCRLSLGTARVWKLWVL